MRHLGPFVAGRGDVVFRSPDLQHGQPLASLIDETRDPPRFTAQPEELVFKEAPSVLLGPKGALAADW